MAESSTAAVASPPEPAPTPGEALLEELLVLLVSEAEAQAGPRRADLRARAALLAWDGRGDLTRALGLLEGIDHPLSPAIELAAALFRGEEEPLHACVAAAKRRGDPSELAELGLILLWRPDAAAQAAELLAGAEAQLSRRLALALAERWDELVGHDPFELEAEACLAAAAVAQDRLGDGATAGELLARAQSIGEATPYLLERLLELGDAQASELYRLKLAKLASSPLTAEHRATRYLLATLLEHSGDEGEAAELVAQLLEPGAEVGPLLTWRLGARLWMKRGEWSRAAEAWERQALLCEAPAWAETYFRRAAELWEARVGDGARAQQLYRELHEQNPGSLTVALALARLHAVQGALDQAAGVLATSGRALGMAPLLELAAQALSVAGADAATDCWREAAALSGQRAPLEALARAYRQANDRPRLIEIYRRLGTTVNARRGAAYLAVAGALALSIDELAIAEAAFDAAADRDPDDLLVHAGRVLLFRRQGRPAELATALEAMIGLATSARARLHRQLAQVARDQLGDSRRALNHYEEALALEPGDVTTLHALARLVGEGGKWERAIALRQEAAVRAGAVRAAGLWCEVGEIHRQLGEEERARQAYEHALERDPRCRAATEALANLHRRQGRVSELLRVLRRELELATGAEERLALQLELAKAADRPDGGDVEAALGAYREALALDPANPIALSGLERLCRHEGRWAELAAAFEGARPTLRTVRARCEALEHLERWPELVAARELELTLLKEPKEQARAARALAELHERRLANPDAGLALWHRAAAADPGHPQAVRALARIYEQQGRFVEWGEALERELREIEDLEPARRLELWLKLGELRQSRLAAPETAAEAFEQALTIDPGQAEASAALVELYTTLGRSEALHRVLDGRAESTRDPRERARVLLQKGELRERAGDLEGALETYLSAFALDPAARAAFTASERLCYRCERWRQAMELYETAIELVEVKGARAYRLADLYARRGQLQLSYLGQPGEAAASYLRALELDPEADAAQAALERIFAAQSDWAGLIAVYERRANKVRDDGKKVEIWRRAARIAVAKSKDMVEAARLYARLHAIDPRDGESLDALERHYERGRDLPALIGILNVRLSIAGEGEEAIALHLRIAQLYEEGLREIDRAIDSYRQVLTLAPSHKEAIEALARLFEGTERWSELIEVTRRQLRLIQDRGQKALLYFKCGSVMESKFGKEDDAIRYYDAAVKTSPACLPAVHGLRDLHLRRQDWPRVIATLELEAKLWTEDKERAGVLAHIGQIYGQRLGDQAQAIKFYESALAADGECLPANRALFDLQLEREEYAAARALATRLAPRVSREGDPNERSEFCRKRALAAEHCGDPAAAAESLVMALEIAHENLAALDALVRLSRRQPAAYDYFATFRELERLYRKEQAQAALARVLTGQATLREGIGDIEGAEELYLDAVRLALEEYIVVEPLVALHERLRRFAAAATVLEAFITRAQTVSARSAARYRLAEILGDGAMEPSRAAAALRELLAEEPDHRPALFRLAQELYLLGRYGEAQEVCERLIQLTAAPGRAVLLEELARYYDYQGRIAEAAGDAASAGRSYRRALELDSTYPPAVLSLARRAVAAGDGAQAQALVDEALKRAAGGPAELPLLRGRARLLGAVGEVAAAIETYGRLLAQAPASHDDRVALAELLTRSKEGLKQAREELLLVISSDLRNAEAYRLLMTVYKNSKDLDRAARAGTMLRLLGYAEPTDQMPAFRANVKRGVLSQELRRTHLLPSPALGLFNDVLATVREALDEIYSLPPLPDVEPAVDDPAFKICVVDAQRLFGLEAEVFWAPKVPGGVLLFDSPKPMVLIERSLAEGSDGERRFLLGRAFEPLRGGYALFTRLLPAEQAEVGQLLTQLLTPAGESSPLLRALPKKAVKMIERLRSAAASTPPTVSFAEWLAALGQAADRAGLLACDDVGAAVRMLARLGGEELAASADGVVALGQVPGGGELVRFFLSAAYHELRSTLGNPAGRF